MGQVLKSSSSVSSPSEMFSTLVLSNRSIPGKEAMRDSSAEVRFGFSVIVAIAFMSAFFGLGNSVSSTELTGVSDGSNVTPLPDTPSRTSIEWYGWTRFESTCCHAPMSAHTVSMGRVYL